METLVALSVYGPRSAAIKRRVDKLRARFAKHVLPIQDVRNLVDQSLGSRTLTEELRVGREGWKQQRSPGVCSKAVF